MLYDDEDEDFGPIFHWEFSKSDQRHNRRTRARYRALRRLSDFRAGHAKLHGLSHAERIAECIAEREIQRLFGLLNAERLIYRFMRASVRLPCQELVSTIEEANRRLSKKVA